MIAVTDTMIETALGIVRAEALRRGVFVCGECLAINLARRMAAETEIERAALGALDDAIAMGKENGL